MSTRLYHCKLDVAVFFNFVLLRILESALKFLCPVPEEKYILLPLGSEAEQAYLNGRGRNV